MKMFDCIIDSGYNRNKDHFFFILQYAYKVTDALLYQ